MADTFHHRPTLKQQNKSHKGGKHISKGKLKSVAKGKIENLASHRPTLKSTTSPANAKLDRLNHARQLKNLKRGQLVTEKRGSGESGPAPRCLALLSLTEDADVMQAFTLILNDGDVETLIVPEGPVTFKMHGTKQRATVLTCQRDFISVLDAAKIADLLVVVMRAGSTIDDIGQHLISAVKAQGLPSVLCLLQGLDDVPAKRRQEVRKMHAKFIHETFPGDPKLMLLDTPTHARQVMRVVANQRLRSMAWREHRPLILAEHVSFQKAEVDAPDGGSSEFGTLLVSGYVRGGAISANRLVHIPGIGSFQLTQIDGPPDPCPVSSSSTTYSRATSHRDSIVSSSAQGQGQGQGTPLSHHAQSPPLRTQQQQQQQLQQQQQQQPQQPQQQQQRQILPRRQKQPQDLRNHSGETEAYAKLIGPNLEYYMRSLSVLLGRGNSEVSPNGAKDGEGQGSLQLQPKGPMQVDCELGLHGAISRRHARIFFNFRKRCFELECYSKHPVIVQGQLVGMGMSPAKLESKMLIQIGDRCFYFLLPKQSCQDDSMDISSVGLGTLPMDSSFAQSMGAVPTEFADGQGQGFGVHTKPKESMRVIILQALLAHPDRKMSVASLYDWVRKRYPFYESSRTQNIIRHNLSSCEFFIRADKDTAPRKHQLWTCDNSTFTHFLKFGMLNESKKILP
mmetsp:Transcript_12307/g.19861  ORF Transcript_12307/g.19861 Transcript_12307/m.19861 type:complete len:678 (+) Transcript_12307:43-2076(+)